MTADWTPAAQLPLLKRATCGLRAQRVSGGEARAAAPLSQRQSLSARHGGSWQGPGTGRAQLLLHSRQATRELCVQPVSGGAACVSTTLRQQPSLFAQRGASWQGSSGHNNWGQWQFARSETHLPVANNAWGDTPTKGREGQGKRNATELNETKQNKERNETKRKAHRAKKRNKRKRKAKWNTTGSEKKEQKEERGEMEQNRERKTGAKGRERRNGTKQGAKNRNKRKRKAKWNTTESRKEEQKEEKGEMEHNREQKRGTKGRERRNGTKQKLERGTKGKENETNRNETKRNETRRNERNETE